MRGIIEASQKFRWQRLQLHIAPQGIAILKQRGLSPTAELSGFADFKDVISAEVVGSGRKATLRIQFLDGKPAWEIPGTATAEAHWAAELIRAQIALIHRARATEFQSPLPFAELQSAAERLLTGAEHATVDVVDFILFQAIFHRASDAHFECTPEGMEICFRVDGVIRHALRLALPWRDRLLNRLKVAAQLSSLRSDVPQEGRIAVNVPDRNVDLRLTTLPTIHGEKISIRFFDPAVGLLALDKLGMSADTRAAFERLIAQPQGMILLTGPASSGKSTTLYAALQWIREHRGDIRAIATVEDPVEFDLRVVNQTQINPAVGLDFASGLRTVLRQDPQVILVGEIRDSETAEIAVRAGLTGHLVMSTMHSRSAAGVFVRLIEIGVEPYLVASAVTAVLAQRLVRTICPNCRIEDGESKLATRPIGIADPNGFLPSSILDPDGSRCRLLSAAPLYRGAGCAQCEGTGYRGRVGLFELLTVTNEMRELMMRRAPVAEFERAAAELQTPPLFDDGLAKVREGVTTLAELERAGVIPL